MTATKKIYQLEIQTTSELENGKEFKFTSNMFFTSLKKAIDHYKYSSICETIPLKLIDKNHYFMTGYNNKNEFTTVSIHCTILF
jgi:hypothetical protein